MGFLPLVPGIGSCFSPCGSVQTTTSSFCRHDNLVYLFLSLSMRPSTNPRDRLTAIPLPRRNPGLSKNMIAKRLLSPIDRSIWPLRSPIPRKQLRDRCEIAAREGRKAYIHSRKTKTEEMYVRGHDGIGGGGIVHSNYPETVLFHYGKSRLHFFTSLCGKMRGRGGGGVSNPENHVERGPSNHWCSRQSCPASASLGFHHGFATPLRILDAILAQKRKERRGTAEREMSLLFEGRRDTISSISFPSFFYTSSFSLLSSLFFSPLHERSPPSPRIARSPSIGQLRNLRPA